MGEPYRDAFLTDEEQSADVVTIASYFTTVEGEMAREYLQANGIRAHVSDSARFNPLMNVAAGGARLMVPAYQETQARDLLQRMERTPTTTAEDDADESDVRCPRCELAYCFHHSPLGTEAVRAGFILPITALLALPFASKKARWHCHKCLYVWDDPEEGPKQATMLPPDEPKPVFRLRRRSSGVGLFLGTILGFMLWGVALAAPTGLSVVLFLVGLAAPFLGYAMGSRSFSDVCSAPHCRARLPAGEEECPQCHGLIAGVIATGPQHYAEAARFRRDLRRLEEEEKSPKRLVAKKPRRKKKASPPAPEE